MLRHRPTTRIRHSITQEGAAPEFIWLIKDSYGFALETQRDLVPVTEKQLHKLAHFILDHVPLED